MLLSPFSVHIPYGATAAALTLSSSNVGQRDVVLKHDVRDEEEVEVRPMGGEQHHRPLLHSVTQLQGKGKGKE